MIRATTPTHVFKFTIAPSTMSKILITYSQNDTIILEKDKDDLTFETRVIDETTYYFGSYTLTQTEANKFADFQPVEVQIRALLTNGDAVASKISKMDVFKVLNDEVLT